MALEFEVLVNEVVADGVSFTANDNPHRPKNPTKALRRAMTAAHHEGSVNVTEGLMEGVVQSQEDAEAALVKAMGEFVPPKPREDGTMEPGYWTGPWYEGHMSQASPDQVAAAEMGIDIGAGDVADIASVMGDDE